MALPCLICAVHLTDLIEDREEQFSDRLRFLVGHNATRCGDCPLVAGCSHAGCPIKGLQVFLGEFGRQVLVRL